MKQRHDTARRHGDIDIGWRRGGTGDVKSKRQCQLG
jgi:hypothetical protein